MENRSSQQLEKRCCVLESTLALVVSTISKLAEQSRALLDEMKDQSSKSLPAASALMIIQTLAGFDCGACTIEPEAPAANEEKKCVQIEDQTALSVQPTLLDGDALNVSGPAKQDSLAVSQEKDEHATQEERMLLLSDQKSGHESSADQLRSSEFGKAKENEDPDAALLEAANQLKAKVEGIKRTRDLTMESQRKVLRIVKQLNEQSNEIKCLETRIQIAAVLQDVTELIVNMTTNDLDYLTGILNNIRISFKMEFPEAAGITQLEVAHFQELAGQLKNVVFPISLVSERAKKDGNQQIQDKGMVLYYHPLDLTVKIWKQMVIVLEGNPMAVLSSIKLIQDILSQAVVFAKTAFKKYAPTFVHEQLDNLIGQDYVRMNGTSTPLDIKTLWYVMRKLQELYSGDYEIKDKSEQGDITQPKAAYRVHMKIVVERLRLAQGSKASKKDLRLPDLEVSTSIVKVMGRLPFQVLLTFRRRFHECYRLVTGENL